MSGSIIVDARMLAYPMTGIGRYSFELLKALTHLVDAEWVLLSHSTVPPSIKSGFAGSLTWIEGRGRGLAESWFQREAIAILRSTSAGVFLGLANSLPLWRPRRMRCGLVVYDLTYLAVPWLTHWQDLLKGFVVNLPAILRADALLAISRSVQAELGRRFPWVSRRTTVLPPGGTRLAPAQSIPAGGRRGFVAVGAHPRKNTSPLLQAYARLSPELRNAHPLSLVARTFPPDIVRQVHELGLDGDVRLYADASDADLGDLYRRSLALVYPSRYEGLGLPVAEALLAGLPAIVPAGSPMAELLQGGGVVLDSLEPGVLASAMTALAMDGSQWERCAAHARRAAQNISWTRAAEVAARALGVLALDSLPQEPNDPGTQTDGRDWPGPGLSG